MWPTKTTEYNITKSPWRNGKGDWVGEWQAACKKYGLKFGVYLSPWDRNTSKFGTPEYLEMYKEQLTELLTNYGDLFTVWFDGAPGEGEEGYYGGANEYRGGFTDYYDWENIYALVRKLQPGAVIFNDPGPDLRWVGNERGYAGETCWTTYIDPDQKWDGRPYAATGDIKVMNAGVRNGTHWIPAECDFSLRRRFTYHASDNNTVKTPQKLFDIYINSVGRGQGMDLNLPIKRDGQQDEADVKALVEFGKYLNKTFKTDIAQGAKIVASNTRGKAGAQFGTKYLLDGDRYSYWATDDDIHSAELTVELPQSKTFNLIRLRENIKLGQRIDSVSVDSWVDGSWKRIAVATSIGACRIIRLGTYLNTKKLRLKFYSPVSIALSELSLFAEPEGAEAPTISRNKDGFVKLSTIRPARSIRYTIDGSEPIISSNIFTEPFVFENQGTIKTAVFGSDGKKGELAVKSFDISKQTWTVFDCSTNLTDTTASRTIDDNEFTYWETNNWQDKSINPAPPQWIAIEMGQEETVSGFSYTPRQDGNADGIVDQYEYLVSNDGKSWTKVAEGYFPNLRNSPVYRTLPLDKPVKCRYFKFVGLRVLQDEMVNVAEIGAQRMLDQQ